METYEKLAALLDDDGRKGSRRSASRKKAVAVQTQPA